MDTEIELPPSHLQNHPKSSPPKNCALAVPQEEELREDAACAPHVHGGHVAGAKQHLRGSVPQGHHLETREEHQGGTSGRNIREEHQEVHLGDKFLRSPSYKDMFTIRFTNRPFDTLVYRNNTCIIQSTPTPYVL